MTAASTSYRIPTDTVEMPIAPTPPRSSALVQLAELRAEIGSMTALAAEIGSMALRIAAQIELVLASHGEPIQ